MIILRVLQDISVCVLFPFIIVSFRRETFLYSSYEMGEFLSHKNKKKGFLTQFAMTKGTHVFNREKFISQ